MPQIDLTLPDDIDSTVERALAEDIGDGDRNAALADDGLQAKARVIVRENAILSGAPWFERSFTALDERVRVDWLADDGQRIHSNTPVCEITGPVRALLSGERTALRRSAAASRRLWSMVIAWADATARRSLVEAATCFALRF